MEMSKLFNPGPASVFWTNISYLSRWDPEFLIFELAVSMLVLSLNNALAYIAKAADYDVALVLWQCLYRLKQTPPCAN